MPSTWPTAGVRRIEARDLDLLQDIEAAADDLLPGSGDPQWPAAAPGRARLGAPGFILVTGDPAVGFVHLLLLGPGQWHLEQLSVRPEHARRGRGRALLRAALAEVDRCGGGLVTLMTFADVPFNAPFYATEGFARVANPPPWLLPMVRAEEGHGMSRWGQRVIMAQPAEARPT